VLSPFVIVKQINIVVFQLKLLGSMRVHPMFHVFLLEPYRVSTIPGRIHDPLLPIEVDGEQKYEVEGILSLRIFNHRL
jgi:hypothetical protein